LPAPLDVAIGAVQDADGSITLPINVPIQKGELQMGKVISSAAGAVGQVLITAIASSPVKVVSGVGALFGGNDKGKSREPRTVSFAFAAGDAAMNLADQSKLQELMSQLRKDRNLELTLRHDLSAADVSIAGQRSSPPRGDLELLIARFRAERGELAIQRARLAAVATSAVSTSSPAQATAALESLRALDRRIAANESSLDFLLSQLQPGAERQADRRTRAAALELARQRLDRVRDELVKSDARDAATRVRTLPPQFATVEGDGVPRIVVTLIEKKK
jgi:hypothetical protein